jgi:hypothetical protein
MGTFNYMCKIIITPNLIYIFVITLNSLFVFRLLIFTLFNFSLLISTLLVRKAFQIWEVVKKWYAIVAMLLDWLYNIFDFVIDFSPSFLDVVESKDGLVYDVRVIGSN